MSDYSIQKKLFIFCIVFFNFQVISNNSFSDEIFNIKAEKVRFIEQKNSIIASGNAEASNNNKKIYADKITYKKKEGILLANGNVKLVDNKNTITAEYVKYNIKTKEVDAKKNVALIDLKGNKLLASQLKYNLNTEIGEAYNIKSTMNDGSYAEAIKGNFNKKKNLYSLKKTNYTTCKEKYNLKGKLCPSWILSSKELIHDKKNKKVKHKNVFLKVKNIPILYSPYISHPDPTVKRQSGFLPPMIKTISNIGRTIKTPYFHVISKDKDITIMPILYTNENSIMNMSYRQAFKNGNLIIESSFSEGYKNLNKKGRTQGSRNYLFAEYDGKSNNFFSKKNNLTFKLQRVSQENYLRVNKLNTQLFREDIRNLENSLRLQAYDQNKRFDYKIGIFENLDKYDSSKYTYYLPDGVFSLHNKHKDLFKINFNSYTQGKKFDKNQKQLKLKNNINLDSTQFILKQYGLSSVLKLSMFNKNIYNDNVAGINNNLNINNNFALAADLQLPLAKVKKNSYQIFTPRLFLKHTTGSMQNAQDQDKILEFADLFSMNRTNNTDTIETGTSLGYGTSYTNNKNKLNSPDKLRSLKIGFGQVINNKYENLKPNKSSLANKSSDFVGYINYDLFGKKIDLDENDKLNISFLDKFKQNRVSLKYKFNIDNNISEINRNSFDLEASYKTLYSKIKFEEKNNHIGNVRSASLYINKLLSNNYYFSFENKRNIKDNSSEYNRLSLNYENDCITTHLTYSKDFYSNKDVSNSKSLIFGITIKPFADSLGPDLTEFIN